MKTPNLKPCPFCGGKANWLLEKTVANGLSNVQIAMPEPKAGAIMIAKVEMKSTKASCGALKMRPMLGTGG